MSKNKTLPTGASVVDHLTAIEPAQKQADARALDALFREVTGWAPQMWGDSLIGYGRYDYRYGSGRTGTMLATGFAARKANFSIYIMPGYTDFSTILSRLGRHKRGKACLYVTKLSDIQLDVLSELIVAGLEDLRQTWPVFPA